MIRDEERLGNFAENLREAMASREGMSQNRLAALSGVPQATISRILAAKHDPSVTIASRLADALSTSLDVLLRPRRQTAGKNFARAS